MYIICLLPKLSVCNWYSVNLIKGEQTQCLDEIADMFKFWRFIISFASGSAGSGIPSPTSFVLIRNMLKQCCIDKTGALNKKHSTMQVLLKLKLKVAAAWCPNGSCSHHI